MAKIKVLMLGPARTVKGGVSSVVNNLYNAGIDREIELKYIGTMVDGSKLRKLLQAAKAYFQVLSCIDRYDIVHIHVSADASYFRKSFFMKIALRHHKKLVLHQHGGDIDRFYGHDLTGSAHDKMVSLFNRCDAFIVLAPNFKEFFKHIIVGEKKISVIGNGISIPDLDLDHKDYSKRNILFLGRICKDKGISELLNAIERLSKEYPDVHLYIGGFYEDESFRSRIESLPENVTACGWIDTRSKEELFAKCPIFVLPSYYEGMPLSVAEGMAHGCATIASKVGSLDQMIDDGRTGLLVRPKDSDDLYNALKKVIEDTDYQKALGRAAYSFAKDNYDITKMKDNIIEIYKDILR
ncbi:glycosyltransferase family 4 protein [Butyrivibrio fibrisolvens]|uniref:glycosyltransferase family 4 protein n=1 Tax=Butyrivibrio fibrisolvens TaxID=831 RepID=UPI000419CA38|nr:glycosyltransferase family 4 protein [Butyrivibrio fibrisolvens]